MALLAPALALAEAPARVVSMNLCTDQYALALAGPGQLISVSAVARDPLVSPMAAQAAAVPPNHGSAEEIFLLAPDLVLASTWSDPAVIDLLRRLGVEVAQFAPITELDAIPGQIAEMGAALGRMAEAQALIQRFETDLAALSTESGGPTGAFFYPNGYTLGPGSLAHGVLERAGFTPLAERLVRTPAGTVPLELFVIAAPDLIIGTETYAGASRSEEILHHPALVSLAANATRYTSGAEWACGTPAILSALRDLRALRREMAP